MGKLDQKLGKRTRSSLHDVEAILRNEYSSELVTSSQEGPGQVRRCAPPFLHGSRTLTYDIAPWNSLFIVARLSIDKFLWKSGKKRRVHSKESRSPEVALRTHRVAGV